MITIVNAQQIEHMELCKNRHRRPPCVVGAIYPNAVNPVDVQGLEKVAITKLSKLFRQTYSSIVYKCGDIEVTTANKYRGVLHLYPSGLGTALTSVINACLLLSIKLIIWHWDEKTGTYVPQIINN